MSNSSFDEQDRVFLRLRPHEIPHRQTRLGVDLKLVQDVLAGDHFVLPTGRCTSQVSAGRIVDETARGERCTGRWFQLSTR